MTRKRVDNQSKKQSTTSIFKEKTFLYPAIILIIIIASVGIISLQSQSDTPTINQQVDTDDKWFFAMDTISKNVGGYQEYRTGYIPTLVIIDIEGNIIHKSSGVHSKEDLLDHVDHAKNPGSVEILGEAPDFTLEMLDGNDFTLSNYKGVPVILDLMAVRCPPCHTQMPELYKLKQELGSEVVILSIDVDGAAGNEKADDVRNAFGEYIFEE